MKFEVSTQLCEFQFRPVRAIMAILEIEFIGHHGTDCRLVLAEKECKGIWTCHENVSASRAGTTIPLLTTQLGDQGIGEHLRRRPH
jgi:hypothetical protein